MFTAVVSADSELDDSSAASEDDRVFSDEELSCSVEELSCSTEDEDSDTFLDEEDSLLFSDDEDAFSDEEDSLFFSDDEDIFSDEEDGVSSTELELSCSGSTEFEDEGESSPQATSAKARAAPKTNNFFIRISFYFTHPSLNNIIIFQALCL